MGYNHAINDKETQWRRSRFKLLGVVSNFISTIGDIVLLSYVNSEKSDGNDLEQNDSPKA